MCHECCLPRRSEDYNPKRDNGSYKPPQPTLQTFVKPSAPTQPTMRRDLPEPTNVRVQNAAASALSPVVVVSSSAATASLSSTQPGAQRESLSSSNPPQTQVIITARSATSQSEIQTNKETARGSCSGKTFPPVVKIFAGSSTLSPQSINRFESPLTKKERMRTSSIHASAEFMPPSSNANKSSPQSTGPVLVYDDETNKGTPRERFSEKSRRFRESSPNFKPSKATAFAEPPPLVQLVQSELLSASVSNNGSTSELTKAKIRSLSGPHGSDSSNGKKTLSVVVESPANISPQIIPSDQKPPIINNRAGSWPLTKPKTLPAIDRFNNNKYLEGAGIFSPPSTPRTIKPTLTTLSPSAIKPLPPPFQPLDQNTVISTASATQPAAPVLKLNVDPIQSNDITVNENSNL